MFHRVPHTDSVHFQKGGSALVRDAGQAGIRKGMLMQQIDLRLDRKLEDDYGEFLPVIVVNYLKQIPALV